MARGVLWWDESMRYVTLIMICLWANSSLLAQVDANRLSHLNAFCDPYCPTLSFAKLTTPQWVGDEGVEAVISLGIDDMREVGPYENYLRPILERLKAIDGTAGNMYTVGVGARQIQGKVDGTGTWDEYREVVIGRVELAAGSHQVVFRSRGPVDNCLIDLRALVIRPAGEK